MPEKWTREQEKAISAYGQNILVSAGAGSGKTAVLSERVYQLVGKRKIDVDHLLVLTFTNKAAAEMKQRIRKKISGDEEKLFGSEEEKKRQINKIDSSFIMTFDAYALSLVRKYHYLLNVDRDIDVIDANILSKRCEELLDEIMNEAYQKGDPVFMDMIAVYCIKDDRNIRSLIMKIMSRLEMVYERDAYIRDYERNFYSQEALNGYIRDLEEVLKDKIAELRRKVDAFSFGVENVEEYFIGIDALLHADDYESIRKALTGLEVSKKRLPSGSGVSQIKTSIAKDIKALRQLSDQDPETLKEEILSNRRYDGCLLSLADELSSRLSAFKKQRGSYSFSDIFRMAIDLVARHDWLAKEVGGSFDEILIDEYQDTNDLQDDFISCIAHDDVYMVGDIKQSIYRFRNANPMLFLKKYIDYSAGKNGELITLPHNFRSRNEVLEDVNAVFDRLMDIEVGGARYREDHHLVAGRVDEDLCQSQHLQILNYPYDKQAYPFTELNKHEVEAFLMAQDIQKRCGVFKVRDGNTVRPCEYRDFCIIVDRTTNFDLYKQILTHFSIPAVIEKDERISDCDLIYAIKAVFTLLEKIADKEYDYDFRFSFLSLARSFLVAMKDEEIYEIFRNEDFEKTELFTILQEMSLKADTMSICEILDLIVSEFSVYEKIYSIGDVKDNLIRLDYLYQLSHSLNRSAYDYRAFNEYLSSIFESDEREITYSADETSANAVKIINIHKAKGLQYKICYFPALDVDFNQSDINDRFLFTKEDGIIMPSLIEGRGLKENIRKAIYVRRCRKEDVSEKLRLLYVALTRSEEKMIMITSLQDETAEGKMVARDLRISARNYAQLLSYIYRDLEERSLIEDVDLNALTFDRDYRLSSVRDLRTLKDESIGKIEVRKPIRIEAKKVGSSHFSKKAGLIDVETIRKMELGTTLHYYLETLDLADPDYSRIDPEYVAYIRRFMEHDLMKDAASGKAYKEYEFIYEEDNERKHGFIDLLMEYEDHFDIIDYKTKDIDDEHYDEQLKGYRSYIEKVSDKKVFCYLYSIIDGEVREVI
jgi:ATP-dependent helicase/nuclease subunit A